MSHELREGVKLESVLTGSGTCFHMDQAHCLDITVREQTGEMAMVPWAEVTTPHGRLLVNLRTVESVSFFPDQPEEP